MQGLYHKDPPNKSECDILKSSPYPETPKPLNFLDVLPCWVLVGQDIKTYPTTTQKPSTLNLKPSRQSWRAVITH